MSSNVEILVGEAGVKELYRQVLSDIGNACAGKADASALDTAIGKFERMVAEEYVEKTYAAGEHVIVGHVLYECKDGIAEAEEWTPGHWKPVTLCGLIDSLRAQQ